MVVYCAPLWYDILKKQAQSHNVPGELPTERKTSFSSPTGPQILFTGN